MLVGFQCGVSAANGGWLELSAAAVGPEMTGGNSFDCGATGAASTVRRLERRTDGSCDAGAGTGGGVTGGRARGTAGGITGGTVGIGAGSKAGTGVIGPGRSPPVSG